MTPSSTTEKADQYSLKLIFLDEITQARLARDKFSFGLNHYLEQITAVEPSHLLATRRHSLYQLILEYKKGRLTKDGHAAFKDNDPDRYDVLIRRRNEVWLPAIIEQITTQSCFIAVGAGHMAGPSSLVKLLDEPTCKAGSLRRLLVAVKPIL